MGELLRDFWRQFARNRGAVGGLAIALLLVALALLAPLISPHSPFEQDRAALLLPPSWDPGGNARYLLGTDDVGRDLLTRLLYGARLSLSVGALVVSIAFVIGVSIGLIAGYVGGVVDVLVMRAIDIMMALPTLLLAIAVVAILGPSLINAMMAVAIVLLPSFVRLTRAAVMAERGKEYVMASRMAGAGSLRLMVLTILPNCLAPLIVQTTLSFSTAILDLAALGFLGLGAQPPTPEWGTMLADALQFVQRAWWVVTFPGFAILITVLAFNLFGDGLRDALDPKLKR